MEIRRATRITGTTIGGITLLFLLLPVCAQGKVDTIQYPPRIDTSRFWYGDGDRLEWSSVPEADSYDLQISESPEFDDGTIGSSEEESGPATVLVRDVEGIRDTWYVIDVETSGFYYWRVRGVDEFGVPGPWSAAAGFQLQVSSVLSPEEIGLTVGPNPCIDCLYRIQGGESLIMQLTMYDVTGRPVLTRDFDAGTTDAAIDLSPLAAGVYHVVTTQADGTVATHPVVVE